MPERNRAISYKVRKETDSHIKTSKQESDKLVSESISKNITPSPTKIVNKNTTKFSMRYSAYLEAVKTTAVSTHLRVNIYLFISHTGHSMIYIYYNSIVRKWWRLFQLPCRKGVCIDKW